MILRGNKLVQAAAVATEQALKHEENEDSSFINLNHGAFGVFDGAGGLEGAAQASRTTRDFVLRALSSSPYRMNNDQAQEELEGTLADANTRLKRGSTTATVAKVYRTEGKQRAASIASSGDSRAYVFDGAGLTQLTIDFDITRRLSPNASLDSITYIQRILSVVEDESDFEHYAAAAVGSKGADTINEYAHYLRWLYERRSSVAALGMYALAPLETIHMDVQGGETILLTTDGVHDNLTHGEIADVVRGGKLQAKRIATDLVAAAKERSFDDDHMRAKQDDITAVVFQV